MDIRRILINLDEYYNRNDSEGAEKYLLYWLSEAERENNAREAASIYNELMGLYRKTGKRDKAVECAMRAEKLSSDADPASRGSVLLNCGTVFTAFGESEKALSYFEKAGNLLENSLKDSDERLGSLYNNMAAACFDIGEKENGIRLYKKAISVMEKNSGREAELAVSYINLADSLNAAYGLEDALEEIEDCVDRAERLMDRPETVRNGEYAFTCTKLADAFEYYGRFAFAIELRKRAEDIYAGA